MAKPLSLSTQGCIWQRIRVQMRFWTISVLVDFDIVPQCTTVENPQANAPVEWVHHVIHNMCVTKELDKHLFGYINPWGEFLNSIAWVICMSYNSSTLTTHQ